MSDRQEIGKTIVAIINGYDNTLYNEQETEDLSDVSIKILQKKLNKINEQIIYFHAENRLLYNYLIWYEKKIISTQEKRTSDNIVLPNEIKFISHQILKPKLKQPLSIDKKRDIAEASFKVLLGYNQKYGINTIQYTDECINTLETKEETIVHLELELIILKKFIQKMNHDPSEMQKKVTAKEVLEFFRDRIHHREALDERKRQKTIRLRFHIDGIEKSMRKVRQIVDTITKVDFEQLQIDIEKQVKEINIKNKMLIFYKRQQSEANMKLNAKKPELFKEIRALATIRKETNNKFRLYKQYEKVQRKMQDEIIQYEKTNDPLRELTISYRVPSISNYVDLKTRQLNLYRQIDAWERKVQIAEHELNLRQVEAIHYPEMIIHPWKYLENPSPVLFYKTSVHRVNDMFPKLNNRSTINVGR